MSHPVKKLKVQKMLTKLELCLVSLIKNNKTARKSKNIYRYFLWIEIRKCSISTVTLFD